MLGESHKKKQKNTAFVEYKTRITRQRTLNHALQHRHGGHLEPACGGVGAVSSASLDAGSFQIRRSTDLAIDGANCCKGTDTHINRGQTDTQDFQALVVCATINTALGRAVELENHQVVMMRTMHTWDRSRSTVDHLDPMFAGLRCCVRAEIIYHTDPTPRSIHCCYLR